MSAAHHRGQGQGQGQGHSRNASLGCVSCSVLDYSYPPSFVPPSHAGNSGSGCYNGSSLSNVVSTSASSSAMGVTVHMAWKCEAFGELLLLLSSKNMPGKKGTRDRKQIESQMKLLISECTSDELNHLLLSLAGPSSHTAPGSGDMQAFLRLASLDTLEVLRGRIKGLSVRCRAVLLQEFCAAMGKNKAARSGPNNFLTFGLFGMNVDQFWAKFVKQVLQSAEGSELTTLKNCIDSSGTFHNLFKLIYEDLPLITGAQTRNEILSHIRREATVARRERHRRSVTDSEDEEGLPTAKKTPWRIKIISDLDDTVWCSGGRFPAGCDRRYPAHSFYPGILTLYNETTSVRNILRQERAVGSGDYDSNALSTSDSNDASSNKKRGKKEVWTCCAQLKPSENVSLANGGSRPSIFAECTAGDSIQDVWKKMKEKAGGKPMSSWMSFARGSNSTVRKLLRRNSGNDTAQGSGEFFEDHNLVMLSARPRVRAAKGFFESVMYRKFQKLHDTGLLHSMPTLLPGSLVAGTKAFLLGATKFLPGNSCMDNKVIWKSVAKKKYKDMMRYMELYPEYDFLFFGDNGQGDVQVALNALKNPKTSQYRQSGPRLADVFIHDVMRSAQLFSPKQSSSEMSADGPQSPGSLFRRSMGGMFRVFSRRHEKQYEGRIHIYSNSLDAAAIMYEKDYISLEGLHLVAHQSCRDLLRLLRRGVYQHKAWRKEHGEVLIAEYQESLSKVNAILPEGLKIDPLPELKEIRIEHELTTGMYSMTEAPS